MVDADADETIVGADVVDAVGNGFADRVVWKVVNIDRLRPWPRCGRRITCWSTSASKGSPIHRASP